MNVQALMTKKNMIIAGASVLLLAVVSIFLVPSLKDGLLGKPAKKKTEMPKATIVDEATFQKGTKAFHLLPFNNPDLEFEIFLPTDWEEIPMVLDQAPVLGTQLVGDIAQFKSPIIATWQAKVIVQAIEIKYETNARNWLKNYILASGFTVQGSPEAISTRKATGSYIYTNNGITYTVHAGVEINGKIATIARFEVPLKIKDTLEFVQKKSIETFKMVYVKEDTVESRQIFTLLDAVKITYPASWQTGSPDLRDPKKISVPIINMNGKVMHGYIQIMAIRRSMYTSIKKETDLLRKFMTETLNINFKKLVSSEPVTGLSSRFIFAQQEIYAITIKKDKEAKELRLMMLGDKEWYIFAYLITDRENIDLPVWARNVRTFELIIESMK